jgi:Family of unknown function (DUF6159)
MMERFRRSLELARASFAVLRADKELLLFPFISFLALAVVVIAFAVPFILVATGGQSGSGTSSIPLLVLGFLFYVVAYSVIFFFNTALVGAALIRLDGGDPTVRDGLRIAVSRLPAILAYAVIAATVGQVLRMISERAGILGTILAGILGFAWSVVTFLVVPVLAVEGIGPIAAIKRSGALLRQTWGEQLVGNLGISLVFGLLAVVVFFVGFALMFILASISVTALVIGIVAMVLVIGLVLLVGAAVQGIYTASVYRYATKGDAGTMFRPETLAQAFRSKSGSAPPQLGVPR